MLLSTQTLLFNSVIDQIERLLKRPGVPEMREKWRERKVEDNIMADDYKSSIWRDFLKYKGNDFLHETIDILQFRKNINSCQKNV